MFTYLLTNSIPYRLRHPVLAEQPSSPSNHTCSRAWVTAHGASYSKPLRLNWGFSTLVDCRHITVDFSSCIIFQNWLVTSNVMSNFIARNIYIERETDRQTDRQTDRDRERQRYRDRQRDKHRDRDSITKSMHVLVWKHLLQIFAHLGAFSRPARSAWLIPTKHTHIL